MNLKLLESLLFAGISQKTGDREGLDTGDPRTFESYEAFYRAYLRHMQAAVDFQCERRLKNFGLSNMIAPDPLFSAILDNCAEKGRDVTQDGARYIFHMILLTGLSNTVDSLAVIRKLVYEDKTVAMDELIRAVQADWNGYERLRARVMNTVPKFGNDDDFVDGIAARLLRDFEDMVEVWNRKQETLLFCLGVGTFENYAVLGRDTWATPDGREAGGPLAPNFSPTAGMDVNGPTSVIKSVTKSDLLRYYSGCPLDIAVNSNEFTGETGVGRMVGLIRSFCDLGGQILTITSTNVEDLRDAQQNPHKHRDLRVRMGGLSAYFIAMAPVQQENIIKRFSR
jgi:formate C-acetyltransferase